MLDTFYNMLNLPDASTYLNRFIVWVVIDLLPTYVYCYSSVHINFNDNIYQHQHRILSFIKVSY